ncbi:MAG: transglycosylase SLT domain-containing protein [Sandaracinus sp.]
MRRSGPVMMRKDRAFGISLGLVAVLVLAVPTRVRGQSPPVPPGIATLVRHGDDAAALRAIAALPERNAAAHYLEGRLHEQRGELAEAAAAYAGATELPSGIARDAALRRGRALLHAGDAAGAEAALAPLSRGDAVVRALIAEAVLAQGDASRARPLLEAVVAEAAREVDTFAARMELAEAQLSLGDRDAATQTLRTLVVLRPEHPDAGEAMAALRLLDPDVALTIDEHLDRAERLTEAHLAPEAVAELEGLEAPRTGAARFLHVRGMALFEARRYEDAADVLTDAAAARGSTTEASDAFHAARALLRHGDALAARRALRAFVRAHDDDPMAVEAEYLAARSELDQGGAHAGRAMQRFLDGPRGRRPTDFAREARFSLAMVALDADDGVDAARRFEQYRASTTRELDRHRGDYWRARALQQAGDRRAALDVYRRLVREEPLGWYALLSRQRLLDLGEPDPAPLPGAALPDEPAPLFALPEEAALYAALGLDRDAAEALRRAATDLRRSDPPRALAGGYLSLFDFRDAYRVAATQSALEHPPTGAAAWAWEAAYPHAFESAVREAAHVTRIAPELVWSVMRQESTFDPEVVSYADAIGLMQLMPATAAAVARRTGTTYARNLLFDATTNVRLGTAYLAELHRSYGVPLCFAAYNAGEHRVEEWLRRGERDLDRYVEDIPYAQTRNYTRRVTASLAHYRFREAPDAGWPDLGMPARVGHAP